MGVFVDARSLACKLQFVLLPPVRTTLDKLLDLIGATRPVGWKVSLRGSSTFDLCSEAFFPEHASLLTVEVCARIHPEATDVPGSVGLVPTGGSEYEAHILHPPNGCVSSASSAVSARGGVSLSGASGGTAMHLHLPVVGSDLSASASQNSSKGTQVLPFHWHTDHQMCLFQEAERPDPPNFAVDAPAFAEQAVEDVGLAQEEEGTDGASSSEPALRRVLCCVICLQARPQFRLYWATAGEDLRSFLDRVRIILNPDSSRFELVCLEPQPIDTMLTILLVPSWWIRAGVCSFVVAPGFDEFPFCMQTAREDQSVESWLPHTVFELHPEVDVYTCGHYTAARFDDDAVPPHGSLLFLQARGSGPPAQLSAQSVLDGLPHCPADSPVPEASDPVPNQALVLGVYFHQTLAILPYGATDEAVAATVHLEDESYHVHWLSDPFLRVSCEGVPVDRFVACRPSSFRCRRPDACGLFFDVRRLGRPVCYHSCHSPRLAVDELLRLVDVDLPGDLRLCLTGGYYDPGSQIFRFADGVKVVMWAEPLGVPGNVSDSPSCAASTAEQSPDPSEGGPPSHVASCAGRSSRSRSPRRTRGDQGSQAADAHDSPGPDITDSHSGTRAGALWIGCCGQQACRPCHTLDTSAPARVISHRPALGCLSTERDTRWNSVEIEVDLRHLHTVLNRSHRSSWAGLLERVGFAVLQSCGARSVGYHMPAGPADCSDKLDLCLSTLVDPPCYDISRQQFPVGPHLGEVLALVNHRPFVLCNALPAGLRLHSSTRKALAKVALNVIEWETLERLDVYTDGSFQEGCSAWACVVIGSVGDTVVSLQWAGDQVCVDPHSHKWLGAQRHGVQEAEMSAVAMMLWWSLSAGLHVPMHLHTDSLCSLQRVVGAWQLDLSDKLAFAGRCLAQAAQEVASASWDRIWHVKGHSGHCWNELADCLAKTVVAEGSTLQVVGDIGGWIRTGDIANLWLLIAACREPDAWPRHVGAHMMDTGVVFGEQAVPLCPGLSGHSDGSGAGRTQGVGGGWQSLRLVTLNVQTLAGDPDGSSQYFEGRVGYLRDQFEHLGAHVVSVQEARTPRAASVLSGNYLRLCSGATPSGHLGVEGWFLRRTESRKIGFAPDDLVVTFWDPRCLCVKVRNWLMSALIVFIHAPTAQDPDRFAWWDSLRARLWQISASSEILVIGDFNTRFDREVPHRIGEFVWPSKWEVPPGLYSLLDEQDLWLPATFPGLHVGQHATWFAPGSLAQARLDYHAVPSGWSVTASGSRVLHEIDTGHHSIDHLPVLLDVHAPSPGRGVDSSRMPRFDRAKMATAQGQQVLRCICAEAPLLPWLWDADTHYHAFQQHVLGQLTRAFPRSRRDRRGSFLSDASWVIRDHRTWLRKQTVGLKLKSRLLWEAVACKVWFKGCRWLCACVCVALDLCRQVRVADSFLTQLRATKKELKVSIRRDRRCWMHDLACNAGEAPVKDVVSRLRPLLRVSGGKHASHKALPAVLLEDGTLATSSDAALERWIRHFSAIEGGHVCEDDCLRSTRRSRLLGESRETVEILPGEVPSRTELEKALQQTAAHKACGPDGLPGGLLKFGSGCVSKPLYQLFLKLAVRGDEATVMKGGLQYFLWKGKGAQCVCAHHHAILVSSVVAKSFHAVLRRRCLPSFESCAAPLQVGGLPKRPVSFAAHVIRLFQGLHKQGNYFLLFLDLTDAFYRVVRALLSSDSPSDDEIANTFRALGLPSSCFQDFREQIGRGSVIDHAGGSEWLQATITEVLSGTWFKLPGQRSVVATTRGTRPGDNLADILFSYVFADVLASVKETMDGCSSRHMLPWQEDMRRSVCQIVPSTPEQLLSLHESTWMDDLCLAAAFPSSGDLVPAFEKIAGRLLDCCLAKGMMPNLQCNKTEVLLHVSGAGSRGVRRSLLSDRDPSLATASAFGPLERVRVVARYKHLGGFLHHRSCMDVEARHRAGQAWTAFQKHKRTVFGHALVDVSDKASLFGSLVLSTLLYGCGAWCRVPHSAFAILQRAYLNMARVMLARHFRGDVRHLCDDRVLALMCMPSLETWFHFHRLSYLSSFVCIDEPVAWALAHAEGSWLDAVRSSLAWLWQQVDGGVRFPSWEAAWEHWRQDMLRRPGVWKRLIKFARESALRQEIIQEGWQQCRGVLLKSLLRAGAILTAFVDDFQGGACACGPCQKVFRNKQAWAVHAFRKHGRVKASRCLVEGTQCPICLKQYAANVQLCGHVERSSFCRSRLIARGFSCVPHWQG